MEEDIVDNYGKAIESLESEAMSGFSFATFAKQLQCCREL